MCFIGVEVEQETSAPPPKKILDLPPFQFLLGPFQLPRETEDNAYAKFWGDKQRALRYCTFWSGQFCFLIF